jgi:phosphate transport system substrate-binding protein
MKKIISLFLLFLTGCAGKESIPPGEPTGYIQIKGSDTMVNVMQALAEEFMKEYPYVFVAVTGGGSGIGIASLINGTCDIAAASRKMKAKEIKLAHERGVFPKEHVVGYDGIAVIVHPTNPVGKLTIDQLRDIFSGKIRNWKEVGGKDAEIVILSREVSSGTHIYFKEHVLRKGNPNDKTEFSPDALLLPSSQAIAEEVAQNPSAIGYFGMGYLNERVKAVAVAREEGSSYYLPTVKNVLSGDYPISRPLFLYTNGEPKGVLKLFLDFVYSDKGQYQFIKTGFIPVRELN